MCSKGYSSWDCLSVFLLVNISMSNLGINEGAYSVAYERQWFLGICLKQLCSRVVVENMN